MNQRSRNNTLNSSQPTELGHPALPDPSRKESPPRINPSINSKVRDWISILIRGLSTTMMINNFSDSNYFIIMRTRSCLFSLYLLLSALLSSICCIFADFIARWAQWPMESLTLGLIYYRGRLSSFFLVINPPHYSPSSFL